MKSNYSLKSLFVLFLLFAGTTLFAQKYAHINSAELMQGHPDIIAADAQLQTIQETYAKQEQDMMSKLETNYNAYLEKVNSGTISQVEAAQMEQALTEEDNALKQFQLDGQNKLIEERQKLYDPIFENVRKVIETYGKENGYAMIFDSSLGAILFESSEDITELVKAKL